MALYLYLIGLAPVYSLMSDGTMTKGGVAMATFLWPIYIPVGLIIAIFTPKKGEADDANL